MWWSPKQKGYDLVKSYHVISRTPLKINMEHMIMEVWFRFQIIFLSKWVICRFQPLMIPGCKHRGALLLKNKHRLRVSNFSHSPKTNHFLFTVNLRTLVLETKKGSWSSHLKKNNEQWAVDPEILPTYFGTISQAMKEGSRNPVMNQSLFHVSSHIFGISFTLLTCWNTKVSWYDNEWGHLSRPMGF